MAVINPQNPGTTEIQSPLIAGITQALYKISDILSMQTKTVSDAPLTAVAIDNSDQNKNRIYEDSTSGRLWLPNPEPVIKKNNVQIHPDTDFFTIDYLGGSITFTSETKPSDTDTLTFSATCITNSSEVISLLNTNISAALSSAQRYKGSYNSITDLQAAVTNPTQGDFALLMDSIAFFAWSGTEWKDTRSIEDLSNYYTKGETDNLLTYKEPVINAYSETSSADNFYYSGNKSWKDVREAARNSPLTGISFSDTSDVTANDTVLSATGKLQAKTKQVESKAFITGSGAPTQSTQGVVGQRYVDTSNGDEYVNVSSSSGNYVWERKDLSKIPNATATLSGSNVAITSNGDFNNIYFYAPSDFSASHTYTFNGSTITLRDLNNNAIQDAWKSGSPVNIIIKSNVGYFVSESYKINSLEGEIQGAYADAATALSVAQSALPKSGGTLTGSVVAMTSPAEGTAQIRNAVVVASTVTDEEIESLSVPAGTIVFRREEEEQSSGGGSGGGLID